MRILVIEDERALCETIVRSLKRLAYSVDFCYDGNKANELLGIEKYDLVLLDLNLPGADGMTVLRTLRQTDKDTGVLILSARCEVADKVEGLDAGANDYLTKPFHLEELEARIRSLTRRRFTQNNVVLNCGKVAFDTKARVAVADGQELSLTRKEIGILEYLLLNQGRPVSQEELLDHVWDKGDAGQNGKDGTNGKTPEFRVNENNLQWRYVGDEIWLNLYDLSILKGLDGADGKDGVDGKDGAVVIQYIRFFIYHCLLSNIVNGIYQ